MSLSKSKYSIIVVAGVVVGAAVGFYFFHSTKKPALVVKQPIKKVNPAPVKEAVGTSPAPTVTSGFVIGVTTVSKSVSSETIGLKITNDGDTDLQFLPDEQFKLVGLTSMQSRAPLPEKTTAGFKGTIAQNADVKGAIVFDSFSQEDSELRFYPDTTQPNYIVVPLIPLPSDQQ